MMNHMPPQKRAQDPPTPAQIKKARESRNLTQEEAADLLGISRRMWFYYEEDRTPSRAVGILLRLFVDGFDFSKISKKS